MSGTGLRERVRPGDALVVHDPGLWAEMIRIGAFIEHQPHHWNHLTVFHHVDAAGTFWGAQGQPGGVSWYDIGRYLDDPTTLTNIEQPKTVEQRAGLCMTMAAMVAGKTAYDYPAIAVDVLLAVDPLYRMRDQWGPGIPCQVVCSSAYDFAAERVGLETPPRDRFCTPADWAVLIEARGWR